VKNSNQRKIIDNIKKKTGLKTDYTLSVFLGLAEKGALARMKRNRGGASVHQLCEVISFLLDEMTEVQIKKCVDTVVNKRLWKHQITES